MPVTYTTYPSENSSLDATYLSFVKLSDSRGINPTYEVTASYKWHTYNVGPRPVTNGANHRGARITTRRQLDFTPNGSGRGDETGVEI
jgi:hypothetical protein